jgi:uncharacterized caspase-like protein
MSEDTSLTNAVKVAAGISLSRAVKEVAGRGAAFVEEVLEKHDGVVERAGSLWARRVGMGCGKLVLIAILALAFLHVASTSTHVDARRALSAVEHRRVALVIGNSAYRHTPRLENPKNDAADMGLALRKLGFRVIEGFDLDKAAFDAKIGEFAAALEGAEVGVLFYAGHGMQVSGQNYLVPVDARRSAIADLGAEMVRLDLVHQTMERAAKTNLLFFDACRDNPLARNLTRTASRQTREIGRGLAPVESGAGTLISFSTQPGNVALDGAGRNSPYSGALIRHLATSREDINAMLIAVRNDVMRQTDSRQVPWEHSALTRRYYFNGGDGASAAPPADQLRLSEASDAWNATRDTASLEVLDAFVARYGNTFFAELARARIEQLRSATLPEMPAPAEVGARRDRWW